MLTKRRQQQASKVVYAEEDVERGSQQKRKADKPGSGGASWWQRDGVKLGGGESVDKELVKESRDDDDTDQRLSSSYRGHVRQRFVEFVERPTPRLPNKLAAECVTVLTTRTLPAVVVLLGLPFFAYGDRPADWGLFNLYPIIRHMELVWSAFLHFGCWPIILISLFHGFRPLEPAMVPNWASTSKVVRIFVNETADAVAAQNNPSNEELKWHLRRTCRLTFAFVLTMLANMTMQMCSPHTAWNPFLWFRYRTYLPDEILPSLAGACLDPGDREAGDRRPLCLGEGEWIELSSGRLSSRDPDDVLAVQRGLDYLRNRSGGIVINALARDVVDSIPALRQNMNGLAALFDDSKSKLALVVFENDSEDGTREGFQSWADEESKYAVDLVSCGDDNPDCRLGLMDRYRANLMTDLKASGVGKLGEFRQITLDYITRKEDYADYSHMMVLDVDLGVSLSPLGLLHALGLEDGISLTHAVASSSIEVWPGTMGTILPPYDFSAFRPEPTASNERVRRMHEDFCGMAPEGDRWRNMCEATSPMQLFMVTKAGDELLNHGGQPYKVASAFNGLTLYPMGLLRERGAEAKYDSGADGQRCEHVGFNASLRPAMYVDPKWTMRLMPERPGGPTGLRCVWILISAVLRRPTLFLPVVGGTLVIFFVLISSCAVLGASVRSILELMAGLSRDAVFAVPRASVLFK
mmetsp:Transcript_19558/g.41873  ORF Transcript_19558/g.41873 Transcript_19558/m.41873 type:complete len:694 (-) Transcript_19558:129-2210(-)